MSAPTPGCYLQPEWAHFPHEKETVRALGLIQRHKKKSVLTRTNLSVAVVRQQLSMLDRNEIVKPWLHNKVVAFLKGVSAANLDNRWRCSALLRELLTE